MVRLHLSPQESFFYFLGSRPKRKVEELGCGVIGNTRLFGGRILESYSGIPTKLKDIKNKWKTWKFLRWLWRRGSKQTPIIGISLALREIRGEASDICSAIINEMLADEELAEILIVAVDTFKGMKEELEAFLNSLTWEEARELYRFLRTRTWTQWIDDIVHNRKIE